MCKKSCWTCEHSIGHRDYGYSGSYWQPPEPEMVEDCSANVDEEIWDKACEIAEINNDEVEDILPTLCNNYREEKAKCIICGKEDGASKMEHYYKGEYICDSKVCELKMREYGL